jgi:ATP-dependent Lon protease
LRQSRALHCSEDKEEKSSKWNTTEKMCIFTAAKEQRMVGLVRIPLFPLHLVLFPEMSLSLHIFEPRYRRMIRQCIEEKQDFGIILQRNEELSKVGCAARVEVVAQEYEDGRFDILVRGRERFRVRRVFEDQPHLEAEVEFFGDTGSGEDNRLVDNLARKASQGLLGLDALGDSLLDSELLMELQPEALSLMICGTGLFYLEEKQNLLESTDTTGRLEHAIGRIGERLRRRNAEKKIEDLLGAPIDFKLMLN